VEFCDSPAQSSELVEDRITGGSAKKILILEQRNQILLARNYFH